ncbi:MAG: hypothetical protein FJ396_00905 [Verrucomicrobia bacterium]|nr:hypothetical protein [Verrucomicrobiota bacterium]
MSFDLTAMLQDWEYKPGQVVARRFQGRDGEKIQLRVDLGILQMNAEGRPDGRKPMGHESWFHFYRKRAEQAPADADGENSDFVLGSEECGRLQQEAIQYHHRYICFFQLADYPAVERDCARNLEVFGFVDRFAESDELSWSVVQFTPQLLMMRTRARGAACLERGDRAGAMAAIETGLDELVGFHGDHDREEQAEQCGEVLSLRGWLEELRRRPPQNELERLQSALAEAIRIEDYETAARVRDQLRRLQASET